MRNGLRILISVCVLLSAGIAWGQVQLDQSQEGATGWFPYRPDYWNGQSFKPSLPYLHTIEGYFYPGSNVTGGEFTVEIWQHNPNYDLYDDPRLGSAPIASKTITTIVTGAQPDCWARWEFDEPIDVSSYTGSQPLMILWNTPDLGPSTTYHNGDPYAGGCRYWLTDTGSSDPNDWTWTQYSGHDMMFRTYGSHGIPDYCGDGGTVYPAGDINRDCYADLLDFALLASYWMHCSDPANHDCDQYWRH